MINSISQKTSNMIVYHHSDMDGKSAAWVCHLYHPSGIEDCPESYIETNYGDKFDKHSLCNDVVLLDISIGENTYKDLINLCKTARTVLWIDHHTTSKEIVENHKKELQNIQNLTYFISECASGAALTYSYFKIPKEKLIQIRSGLLDNEEYDIKSVFEFKNNKSIINVNISRLSNTLSNTIFYEIPIELPIWLAYVDDYDCWKKNYKNSELFNLGFETNTTSIAICNNDTFQFNIKFWDSLKDDNAIFEIVKSGEIINKYIQKRYIDELKNTFEWEYKGTKFICKNCNADANNFLGLINKYDAAIAFRYSGSERKWKYSIYSGESSNFDCSKFCKEFGGGGHFHASGFSSKNLLFISNTLNNKLENIIFLGGTTNEDKWREKFIHLYKKYQNKLSKIYNLFNPINDDLTEDYINIKNKAKINLFVITPKQTSEYIYSEIIEQCHKQNKVYFAILDEFNEFDMLKIKNFEAIGRIVEYYNGKFKIYKGKDGIEDLVKDIINNL